MTRALARSHFHRSSLIRVLTDMALVDAVEPGGTFAEKLGQWVDIASAITLRSVHSASVATPAGAKAPAKASSAVGEEFARVRAALVQAIQKSELPKPGGPLEVEPTFEPYRRYYMAQQRDMALKVPRLQARVRAVLVGASPALKQLAALDEAFATMLSEREDQLLSKLPSLLALRFKHLQQGSPQAEQPGGWLARFGHELQTVLLAELDVRLQPTVGLLEALNPHFDQEKTHHS
ncbi:MAG: hypothetical protein FD135_1871 [Comamonadaceae bacterium]|nr:MAG: hypothetical protein FD135_1871 [Comamonadaceae bacterium]